MSHDTGFMESGLTVNKEGVTVHQVSINDLVSDLELVGNTFSLFFRHTTEESGLAGLLIEDHVGSGMLQRSVLDHGSESLVIDVRYTLREGELAGHEDGDTDLISGDIRIG